MGSNYDSDFYSWTLEQANLLRKRRWHELDGANLIEEIESMGRSEKREFENRLIVLLAHLLKWRYQSNHRSNSWEGSIREQRNQVKKCLKENPSFKSILTKVFVESYDTARFQAMKETNLPIAVFPSACPWTPAQVFDDEFWPDQG